MIKAYTIASGKGGTGKTTTTVNLGTALAQLGKETYILDADVGMANIGILLGLENVPVTLHEVLAGKATIEEAVYDGPAGLKVVPCGISLQGFQDANPDRLREVMHELVNKCDYLLIDAPAGISRDGVVPLAIADEVILVVNPELSSIVDALKTKILTELVGGNVRYAIINRAGRDNVDFVERKIEKSLGVQSLGAVPEDTFVRESAAYKTPIVIKHPTSPASRAIKRIAAEIAGCEYHDDGAKEREGFIDRLARTLFRGKN
ncbi:septum site-determining protein MinD [Methanofollis aquaemaris]|uniref:Septum site-determining protein MinD n=1 Tax=Methanofollis aquaemaris TaxID=126734 RepID=A0A8A3S5D8_9EURY|nr:cell division ATPase MinD [Methanofollis aquaemaris]QSZ66844.1 septum site-determining protein MinD [Methanofollis aquaemaris]